MKAPLVLALVVTASSVTALSTMMVDRRRAVTAVIGGTASSFPALAFAQQQDVGESIRRGAANLPGYGPTDVFYPPSFQGRWKVTREEVVQDKTVEYEMRFISSIESNAVVADRGSNQAALEKALSGSSVRSYEWLETNPNDLRLVFEDGLRKDIKTTKRASEKTEDTVSSSEFQRITIDRGIPVIEARRTLCKWKVVNESTIEGLEIVYDMGGGDPLAGGASSSSAGPQLIAKSRLHLSRLQ